MQQDRRKKVNKNSIYFRGFVSSSNEQAHCLLKDHSVMRKKPRNHVPSETKSAISGLSNMYTRKTAG